jgi:hypothetical protein
MTDPKPMPKPMDVTRWAEFRRRMPQLMDSEGVWEGWYRYYDAATGALVDQHRSRLICRIMDADAPYPYYQTNQYFWEDGRTDFREFPAWYEDGRIWWDNDLITGWAAPMQPDDYNRSTCLNWTRKGEPDLYLYEMIQHSASGQDRARVWQWFKGDVCHQRTLISEKRVSRDWKSWTEDGPPRN